ncbi:hypothetical protein CALCODRAFT_493372 [Calocera cornea HHB12733]|uniref:Uncharacterized protein n=1 Tax=Calocera cornea HHB12733 TaxID=1353952 RepID=A0A165HRJ7_9BASI|nr:hypothetical protein CALCODRAFT_493372 [Calocera cornea HHB12733]
MDLLDTAWCPVCDRQIAPAILTAPPTPAPTVPSSLAPAPAPAQQPIKTRGGTIKAAPGSRRAPAGHARSKSSANVPSPSPSPPAPSASPPPKKEKVKTYISQAPTPLYCSPECELRDAMSALSLSIPPSPTQATYAAYTRHTPHPPSSPIMISGSSSSSDAGGSYGSPYSTNSDYFAFLEGRPRRPSQTANTGSSAESLSSLNQYRALPPTIRTPASRSRRTSSSSLAPRTPHSAGYAHSPPAEKQYTLSFTRAPASTASPSNSPPAISIIPAYAARRERSLSRASSSLREAAGMALPLSPTSGSASVRSIPRSQSDMSPHTPRPFTPLEARPRPTSTVSSRRMERSPEGAGVRGSPLREEEEQDGSKFWSWSGKGVPTYQAMPVRPKEGTPDQRKRMFYFQQ